MRYGIGLLKTLRASVWFNTFYLYVNYQDVMALCGRAKVFVWCTGITTCLSGVDKGIHGAVSTQPKGLAYLVNVSGRVVG